MRGGGLNHSDEPKVPPVDADKTISEDMALELQTALACSGKNKMGDDAKSKSRNDREKQSKLEYAEKIFSVSPSHSEIMPRIDSQESGINNCATGMQSWE